MRSRLVISLFLLFAAIPHPLHGDEILRSVADIERFLDTGYAHEQSLCLTGVVLRVENKGKRLTLQDKFGQSSFYVLDRAMAPVEPGERIIISGCARISKTFEPELYIAKFEVIGREVLPPRLHLALKDIDPARHHLLTITTEGVVTDVFADEVDSGYTFATVRDGLEIMTIAITCHADELKHLLNARISITGTLFRTASGERKFSGPFISVSDICNLMVLSYERADPSSIPSLETRLYLPPTKVAKLGKRKTKGQVLAVWGKNQLMLRTTYGQIVHVSLAAGKDIPPCGTTITAIGYPETDMFRMNLSQATYLTEDNDLSQPESEPPISVDNIFFNEKNTFNARVHGRLISTKGIVESIPSEGSTNQRILLRCGQHRISIDPGSTPRLAEDIRIGCELAVTGRCLLEIDLWRPDKIFPRIKDAVVVIRKPDDIRVLSRPSWWTTQRLSVVIGLLLAVLLGLYARNRFQKRIARLKLGERTRLAVELHDSLSQTLAGVACQIAASDNAIDAENAVAKDRIKTAERMLKSCRTELRHCLFDLRSDTLEEKDFSAALRKTLDQLEGDADIAIRFNVPRSLLDDAVAHAIIAIVRELTGNALRHGNATKVRVAGSVEDGHVHFSVADNGSGFDPTSCAGSRDGHFGLEGIRDRMKKLRGTFEIKSVPDKGTKAVLTLPLRT